MISFYDASGKVHAVYTLTKDDEPLITLNDTDENLRAVLADLNTEGPSMALYDDAGQAVWSAP